MRASEFVRQYASRGPRAWEAAALELFRRGEVPENPWVPITVADGTHTATLYVTADYLMIGEPGDELRLPLTPRTAQEIANLYGGLLPTPLLVYRIWQQSVRLPRTPMAPNRGMDLDQFLEHSRIIDAQAAQAGWDKTKPLSGHKKDVAVSKLMKPGKVNIFGWYKPEPDVFTDNTPMDNPERQPRQPNSNVHSEDYGDYSHGERIVYGMSNLDGQDIPTEKLYTDPELAHLVSHEGSIKIVRYPSSSAPHPVTDLPRPGSAPGEPSLVTKRGYAEIGLLVMAEWALQKRAS